MNKIELAKLDQVGRGATIKIAASNASILSKKTADYICDGTADEAEINAAIASLEGIGGCVELSEGTFNLSNFITAYDGIWLKGQGASTKIINLGINNDAIAVRASKVSDVFIQSSEEATNGIILSTRAIVTNCVLADCFCGVYAPVGSTGMVVNNLFYDNSFNTISTSLDVIIENNYEEAQI